MAQAKKKIVVTFETQHYDTLKALDVAKKVAQTIREQTPAPSGQAVAVLSVQVK